MEQAGPGKKRIVRRARWHFSGGDAGEDYCSLSCGWQEAGRCQGDPETGREACPYVATAFDSDAAEGVWAVIERCENQVRLATVSGPGGGMTAFWLWQIGCAVHLAALLALGVGETENPTGFFAGARWVTGLLAARLAAGTTMAAASVAWLRKEAS